MLDSSKKPLAVVGIAAYSAWPEPGSSRHRECQRYLLRAVRRVRRLQTRYRVLVVLTGGAPNEAASWQAPLLAEVGSVGVLLEKASVTTAQNVVYTLTLVTSVGLHPERVVLIFDHHRVVKMWLLRPLLPNLGVQYHLQGCIRRERPFSLRSTYASQLLEAAYYWIRRDKLRRSVQLP